MVLFTCKLEPDILMQQNGDMCEYIYVYVDDLEIVESYPKVLMHDI